MTPFDWFVLQLMRGGIYASIGWLYVERFALVTKLVLTCDSSEVVRARSEAWLQGEADRHRKRVQWWCRILYGFVPDGL